MKKTTKSNPLKTFNDNHDKRVSSFNKNLKKFQGNIGSSQVLKAFGPKRIDYVYPNPPVDKLKKAKEVDKLKKAKEFASDALRKEIIKSITNREKPLAEDSIKAKRPIFLDPSTGNMNYQKKGGQTKSKKK